MSIEQVPTSGGARETHMAADSPEALGADVAGILDSVDVPIIIVSLDGILTGFNRAASDVLSLTRTDTGRPPSAIAALGDFEDLEKLCAQAISEETPIRRDIRIGDRRFLLRVAPCATSGGQITGAVLTICQVVPSSA